VETDWKAQVQSPWNCKNKGAFISCNFVAKLDEDTTFNLEEKEGWLYFERAVPKTWSFKYNPNGKLVQSSTMKKEK